jgi:hypothetical protein
MRLSDSYVEIEVCARSHEIFQGNRATQTGVLAGVLLGSRIQVQDFGYWYNQIRPHQNLGGLTPLEAWDGVDAFDPNQPPKEIKFYQAWD